jgi:hypothetical protein
MYYVRLFFKYAALFQILGGGSDEYQQQLFSAAMTLGCY